jgi:hypothetical protein
MGLSAPPRHAQARETSETEHYESEVEDIAACLTLIFQVR